MNQALFVRVLVSEDEIAGKLRPPFPLLFQAIGSPPDGLVHLVKGSERPRGPF
jgi:hypothetical protein